jgi:hypothetical protein
MSSVIEISRPSAEPVSLVEGLQFLKQTQLPTTVPPTDPEASLIYNVFIPAARRYIEDLTGLTLANRNFLQYEDGFPFFPYFQSPYAPLFGAAFPFYFGYGPIASYPYPAIGGLQNQMLSPFVKRLTKTPLNSVQKIIYIGTDGQPHQLTAGIDFVVDYSSTPGRVSPLPGQRWPVGILGVNTVQIFYSAGYQATAGQVQIEPAIWEADLQVPQYGYIYDTKDNVWVQTTAGTQNTGTTRPTFELSAVGAVIADGTASWTNYGPCIGPWIAGQALASPTVIFDVNGNLQLLSVANLTTGATAPTFSATRGVTSSDNSVSGAWRCLGPNLPGAANPPNELTTFLGDVGIPEQLKAAIMIMVSHLYYNRDAVVAGNAVDVPHSVSAICAANRVWDFGPIQT